MWVKRFIFLIDVLKKISISYLLLIYCLQYFKEKKEIGMCTTNNDYEEAIRGASIHAHVRGKNKKGVFDKPLLFSVTVVMLLSVGFNFYREYSLEKVQLKVENLLDNDKITQQVLEIGREEETLLQLQSEEDEYLSALKHSADSVEKDKYLVALEGMEIDVLSESQSKSKATPNLNKSINKLVDEAIIDNSKLSMK